MASRPARKPATGEWRPRRFLKPDVLTGYTLISPAAFLLLVLLAYPFVLAVWISLTNQVLGGPGKFVGIANYLQVLQDPLFRQTVRNTFVYTLSSVFLKITLGIILALVLNQKMRFQGLVRGAILLPWIVPTSLSILTWLWMFSSMFGVINYILRGLHIISRNILWLGDPFWAMVSVVTVNTWRGLPFFAISFLAGLMTIPKELYEAAQVDGAGAVRRFWSITLPLLQPIMSIVVLFSTIWTFSDFQTIYILTHGGPINATQVLSTMSYDVALVAGYIGQGSAIALFLFPMLLAVILLMLRFLGRD
jgi:multiple sugar transport system permease protein